MSKTIAIAWLVLLAGCKEEAAKKEEGSPPAAPQPVPPPIDDDHHGVVDDIQTPAPPRPPSFTDAHMAAKQKLADVGLAGQKVVRDHTSDCEKTGAALAAVNAKFAADVAAAEKTLAPLENDAAATAYLDHSLSYERSSAIEVVALMHMCKGHVGVRAALAAFLPMVGMGDATGGALAGASTWSGSRPPGVTDEMIASLDAQAAWFRELIAAADKAKGDCAAMASSFTSIAAKGKALGERVEKAQAGVASRSVEDEWLAQYTAQAVPMEGMMTAMGPCMSDPAVEKAFKDSKK